MKNFLISGAGVYAESGVLHDTAVLVSDHKISAIGDEKNYSVSKKYHFPAHYHLIPGLIDLHIHGANGKDVMDGDVSAFEIISAALAKEGVTSFLATTMTAAVEKIESVLVNVNNFMRTQQTGAKILGVHLEGPFLSPNKVGAQRQDKILAPDIACIQRWQQAADNVIKLVTLAPELANSEEFIRYLRQQEIVASIGHTDATYEQAVAAIDAGCQHVTHLFNAMRPLHQREPGVVAAALLADHVSAELIVDGVHLHPAIVELIMRVKKNLVLVTDAMRAKCMPDGVYELGDQDVEVKQGIARLRDGTLAGSTLQMFAALKNLIAFTGCSLQEAVRFAAENPARTLGVFQRKGSIAVGKDADLVVLDDKLNVVMTVVEGRVAYLSACHRDVCRVD